MHHTMCAIRARANCKLMAALSQRETASAAHFNRLCKEREPIPLETTLAA